MKILHILVVFVTIQLCLSPYLCSLWCCSFSTTFIGNEMAFHPVQFQFPYLGIPWKLVAIHPDMKHSSDGQSYLDQFTLYDFSVCRNTICTEFAISLSLYIIISVLLFLSFPDFMSPTRTRKSNLKFPIIKFFWQIYFKQFINFLSEGLVW